MIFRNDRHVQRLLKAQRAVIKQFDQGQPGSWKNKDFETLSFRIKIRTKVYISAATLKRIFGKNKTSDTYYPQEATLKAMETYGQIQDEKSDSSLISSTFRSWKFLLLICIIVISGTLLFILLDTDDEYSSALGRLQILSIDGNAPATVQFNSEIPQSNDSMFVSFGDNEIRRAVYPGKAMLTHVYRYPGRFDVHVYKDTGGLSDTLSVLIPSNGWSVLASYYNQSHRERYFPIPINSSFRNGIFHASKGLIAGTGMDTTRIIELRLDNFRQTGIDGDNFKLKTRLKNIEYWPALRCYAVHIHVVGKNEQIMIKLTNTGCSGWGEFILSEQHVRGSDRDLSAFSVDVQEWNEVEIKNISKSVKVMVNDDQIFDHRYQKALGNIVGVSLIFHGSGFIDYFHLTDHEGQPVFMEEFEARVD